MRSSRLWLSLLICLAFPASAAALADQSDWPVINGVFMISRSDCATCSIKPRQIGTNLNDKLLGGHESNVISGRGGSDVLWGDHFPSGQPTSQNDLIYGGDGPDFIYGSHGYNRLYGGRGNDRIRAHFGHGLIDCGPGFDRVHVARVRRDGWSLRHCERIDYRTE